MVWLWWSYGRTALPEKIACEHPLVVATGETMTQGFLNLYELRRRRPSRMHVSGGRSQRVLKVSVKSVNQM